MESSDTRPPWASFSWRAASSAFRSGPLISERALLRSRVRVSSLTVTSSDLGTAFMQTMVCRPRMLSAPVPPLTADRLAKRRQDLPKVIDDAVVGGVEDGRLRVRVDGDHRLRILDADGELHGAADTADDCQLRPRHVPRLPDHRFAIDPPFVDGDPAGADPGLDEGGQPAPGGEAAATPAAADDQPLGGGGVAAPARPPPSR